jgi:hypothetical protein
MADPLSDRVKLAFTFATDAVKQLLTLATAILTFSLAFSSDVVSGASAEDRLWLQWCWLVLAVSITAGGWTLLAMTGVIANEVVTPSPTIYEGSVRGPAAVQTLTFVVGLCLLATFGWFAISTENSKPASSSPGTCTIEAPAAGTCTVPASTP